MAKMGEQAEINQEQGAQIIRLDAQNQEMELKMRAVIAQNEELELRLREWDAQRQQNLKKEKQAEVKKGILDQQSGYIN